MIVNTELIAAWRERARDLAPYAPAAAKAFEVAAIELEAADAARASERLTLAEASQESGYSADHLRHLVASGSIPNAGKRGAPRIARSDLPRRAARGEGGGYDPAEDALRLVRPTRSA